MRLLSRPETTAFVHIPQLIWALSWVAFLLATAANGMTDDEIVGLREDARFVFYHGLTNYHRYAYPEDELRPLSCEPLTRDRANPAHIEVNDVLGNYSLSLVDSLSTLAILASTPQSFHDKHNALLDFQRYVGLLTEDYGDGTRGPSGQGRRARGFDLDSKVQVFETTIRGVGGLLSAHLFAVGDLPIRGYKPVIEERGGRKGIFWDVLDASGQPFVYDGQLLRLATDLAVRLLPAFHTPTGLPYPRVNLRHGTPFYENSPLNNDAEHGQCHTTQIPKAAREITETCSAGAGSLVLEFTTLSRLTGDDRFESLAKRAFWAVWERRSGSGLIGAGIDAETGTWVSPYTGIGAGIDSFFEYAFKSHILLSGLEDSDGGNGDSSTAFLETWHDAHAAISRHIYRGPQFQHPHYAQNDLYTGGPRLAWIDSLSAYYQGLLTLAGELDEAISTHLLFTALWTRYGALPERWNTFTGKIDAGLRWWGGRPEFIESTWYLFRATQDPWYLHVGEMTLRDIKRRCFTTCGWAGLQDVCTGEQSDRMESFFLGETAKYLYLLFDPDHPLNTLDAPFVFTTEGHPLIVPRRVRRQASLAKEKATTAQQPRSANSTCPLPPSREPFSISATAARSDLFHAAALARLHQMPQPNTPGSPLLDYSSDHPSISVSDVRSPSNYTFYPWTLPIDLIPANGFSSRMAVRQTFDLTFPTQPNTPLDLGALQRQDGGIMVNSVSGLRFGLVLDNDPLYKEHTYRIYALSNLALGRDESIWLSSDVVSQINPADPHMSRMKDTESVDLIIDATAPLVAAVPEQDLGALLQTDQDILNSFDGTSLGFDFDVLSSIDSSEQILDALPQVLFADGERLADHLESIADLSLPTINIDKAFREAAKILREHNGQTTSAPSPTEPSLGAQLEQTVRYSIAAMLATGPGAAALPLSIDTGPDPTTVDLNSLPYQSIYTLDDELCNLQLPAEVAKRYNVLIIRRGGCSFSDKIANIPSFAPTQTSLQLVIIVSFPEHEDEVTGSGAAFGVRPFLDKTQLTPSGVERRNPIPAVMTSGGTETWEVFERAASAVGSVENGQVVPKKATAARAKNDDVSKSLPSRRVDEKGSIPSATGGGIGIRRKFWFASQGIRIANLHVKQYT